MVQEIEIDFSSVNDVAIDGNSMDTLNLDNENIWNRFEPTIFAVKRFTPQNIQSNGPAGSQIVFNVTAGTYDAYVEYGGNTTTIPAGTTTLLKYGTDGTTDDGTPESGNITFSGDVAEIAGEDWDYGSKSIKSGYGCITGVVQWGSVPSLGAYLFSNATLTEVDLTMSNRITKISNNAFFRCNIETVKLPKYYVSISYEVFAETNISNFEFPEWLTSVPISLLESCSKLKSITIPKTVTSFAANATGSSAFQASGLESIEFEKPIALTAFPAYTFAETKITTFTIPENVTSLGTSVFYNCNSLTEVIFENPNGWVDQSGNAVDFSDPSANATTLKAGGAVSYSRS